MMARYYLSWSNKLATNYATYHVEICFIVQKLQQWPWQLKVDPAIFKTYKYQKRKICIESWNLKLFIGVCPTWAHQANERLKKY